MTPLSAGEQFNATLATCRPYIYIYIYIHRERERVDENWGVDRTYFLCTLLEVAHHLGSWICLKYAKKTQQSLKQKCDLRLILIKKNQAPSHGQFLNQITSLYTWSYVYHVLLNGGFSKPMYCVLWWLNMASWKVLVLNRILMGTSSIHGGFSIAMFDYRRVYDVG